MRTLRLPGVILGAALAGCDAEVIAQNRLASECMRASDDNRVKLSSSLLAHAEVEIAGDLVEVRAHAPVGVGLDARLRWRVWEYRCRRRGDAVEFLGYRTYEPED